MYKKLAQIALFDRRHVQFALIILSLAVLVLGVGAPADGGGPTRCLFDIIVK
jgi:hypothetical protein